MNAITGLMAETALMSPAHPDADLIRLCAEHVVNMNAYNRDGGEAGPGQPDPLWDAYASSRDAITAAKPRTMAGLLAKARAAKAEAATRDNTDCPEGTPAATWAWALVNDLLDRQVIALDPEHADAGLVNLLAEAERLDSEAAHMDDLADAARADDARWREINQQTDAIDNQAYGLRCQAAGIPALTIDGWRAKAQLVLACLDADGMPAEMAQSLARDVLSGDARGMTVPSSLDADLIKACAAFDAIEAKRDALYALGNPTYIPDENAREDLDASRMLHMAVFRSPLAHAVLNSVIVDAAKAAPGVRLVLTGKDVATYGKLPSIDLAGPGNAATQRMLALERVRFAGEPVAVVIADDPWSAAEAAALITLDLTELPVVLDAEQAAGAEPAGVLYPELGSNIIHTCHQQVGDVDAAFANAHRIVEDRFRIHRYIASPMETRGVLADPSGQGNRITVTSSTQFPHLLRGFLAGTLGMADAEIRVIAPDVGGGFGVKCEYYPEEVLAVVAAIRLGRPVRWIESREEHFVATTHAREQVHEMRAAVDAEGIVTAVTLRSITDNGAAAATLSVTPASISSAMLRGPYRIPNYRAESHSVVTNKTPLAVYRGAGHPQAVLCMELTMDRIAREMGIDRVELRKRNMLTPADMPSDRGTAIVLAGKVVYDSGDYPSCLDRALALAGWAERAVREADVRARGKLPGTGIVCFVEETAIGPYETGHVRVDGSGKVTVLTGASPHGQGTATAIAQLVADEFEIDIDRILVRHGDTDVVTDGVGTFASRGGAIAGAAARLAARKVKDKALLVAAEMMQAPLAEVTWAEGEARSKTGASATLAAIAGRSTAWNAMPGGLTSFNLDEQAHHQVPGIAFANATHVCAVEIDPETGQIEVTGYAVVHDCGTVINPMIVEGQVIGGIAQGLGGTLFEELRYDEQGRLQTRSFADYLLPTAADMPRHIVTGSMVSPSPLNPFGMKGAGEGGTTGSVGAIAGAVADALAPLGVPVTSDGPFTPPAILRLIRSASRAQGTAA